ncbi:MAG TPA: hypothetical protein VGD27_12440, partial [Longimicrobiales bacterium]
MSIAATPTFHAIAEAVVPETAQLAAAEWQAFEALIDTALARRSAAMRRQLGIFVRLLGLLARLRHGHSLDKLPLAQRAQFLTRIQNSRLLLFRRGFWGIRTLVFMGYYARPECAETLGYAAAPRG